MLLNISNEGKFYLLVCNIKTDRNDNGAMDIYFDMCSEELVKNMLEFRGTEGLISKNMK